MCRDKCGVSVLIYIFLVNHLCWLTVAILGVSVVCCFFGSLVSSDRKDEQTDAVATESAFQGSRDLLFAALKFFGHRLDRGVPQCLNFLLCVLVVGLLPGFELQVASHVRENKNIWKRLFSVCISESAASFSAAPKTPDTNWVNKPSIPASPQESMLNRVACYRNGFSNITVVVIFSCSFLKNLSIEWLSSCFSLFPRPLSWSQSLSSSLYI
jgi:hypothetical protein